MTRALAVTLLTGCSIVNDPALHQRVEREDFCARFAELSCEAYTSCCPAPEELPSCIETFEFLCATQTLEALVNDERTGYDAAVAAEVVAEGYAYVRGGDGHARCDLGIADWYKDRTGFSRFWTGTRPAGSDCTDESDWMSGSFDLGALLSCDGTDHACVLDGAGGAWSCLPRRDEGGTCFSYSDCADGLRCTDHVALSGRCRARLPVGAPCADDTDCESLACEGARCVERRPARVFCGFMAMAP